MENDAAAWSERQVGCISDQTSGLWIGQNHVSSMVGLAMNVTIEVFSDVICPWCYVGKRRLEMALDLLAGSTRSRVSGSPSN